MSPRPTIPQLALWLPLTLLMLSAALDLGWLSLQRAVLGRQTQRACRLATSAQDPQAAAWEALLSARGGDCERCALWAMPVEADSALICQASVQFEPLLGLLTRPQTLESRSTVPLP